MATIDKSLFSRIGGLTTLQKFYRIFYNKSFNHPCLKLYFTDKPQTLLDEPQTDFMAPLVGGPKKYAGKMPKTAQ